MKRHRSSFLARSVFILMILCPDLVGAGESRTPPAPLYRDPVFDGAADPSLIWNDKERSWWVFYT
ncbi:MAG: family 43 glycosylhydrolase, partial [Candidatus Aminicenantes bacterium]|nr:family 43 glycosylhydrolase [Candidatus Aminicenantes bacterium]